MRVAITKGWGATDAIIVEGNVKDLRGTSEWMLANIPDKNKIAPWTTYTNLDEGTVVDYGSHVYFGFVFKVKTSENKKQNKDTQMSNKKPYSKIQAGKMLRQLEKEYKAAVKNMVEEKAPAWYKEAFADYHNAAEAFVKLRDRMYVQETENSKIDLSDETKTLCPKRLRLARRRESALEKYLDAVEDIIDIGWVEKPTQAEKKPAKKADKKPTKKAK